MALTPQQTLRKRILRILLDFEDGRASRKQVLQEMERRFGSSWTPEDRSSPNERPFETKWMNRASFERADMVREGLLKDKASGLWTLTDEGRRAAKRG